MALAGCATKQPAGTTSCSRAGVDVPGSTPMRDGGDAGRVDAAAARAISDGVANDVLRTIESKHRPLALSLIDFDVQPREPGAGEGCLTYSFFYVYRQPTGRELGPGESHFDVFVTEEGKAWVLWGK